jgi:hypothetical protein
VQPFQGGTIYWETGVGFRTSRDMFEEFRASIPEHQREALLEGLADLALAMADQESSGLALGGKLGELQSESERVGGAISTGAKIAGGAISTGWQELAGGATSVAKDTAANLLTSLDGLAATVLQPLRDLTGAIYSLADGNGGRAWEQILRASIGLTLNPVAGVPLAWATGVALDFLAELRGEWSGRSLNAEERDLLHSVFGNDINLDRIKIVYDATSINTRRYTHGTTIFVPGSESLDLATLVHEATHVVQKQKYHFDVTGRGVVDQVAHSVGKPSVNPRAGPILGRRAP